MKFNHYRHLKRGLGLRAGPWQTLPVSLAAVWEEQTKTEVKVRAKCFLVQREIRSRFSLSKVMSSRDINAILLKISDQLSSEQLKKMKFLCKDDIGKKDMEKISAGSQLFQFLMERGKLSADNTEYVCRLLRNIERHDLSEKLQNLDAESEDIRDQPDETERGRKSTGVEGGVWLYQVRSNITQKIRRRRCT